MSACAFRGQPEKLAKWAVRHAYTAASTRKPRRVRARYTLNAPIAEADQRIRKLGDVLQRFHRAARYSN